MTFDRRSALTYGALLSAGVVLDGCKEDKPEPNKPTGAKPGIKEGPSDDKLQGIGVSGPVLEVLAAVSERILPSEGDGPGAKEADVRYFLESTLSDERLSHLLPLLKRGAGFLARAAQAEYKQARFAALGPDKQDDLIDRLANKKFRPKDFDGPTFVRIMVALTLEGYLGDPKHGGNSKGAAWEWLGFSPAGRNKLAIVPHGGGHGGHGGHGAAPPKGKGT
jgi:gluconate 2-dehydrogenase gamma chain